jgi:hypothetical protein
MSQADIVSAMLDARATLRAARADFIQAIKDARTAGCPAADLFDELMVDSWRHGDFDLDRLMHDLSLNIPDERAPAGPGGGYRRTPS